MLCPQCRAQQSDEARWCSACGTSLQPAIEATSAAVLVAPAPGACPRCGTPNLATANWCGNCGAALSKAGHDTSREAAVAHTVVAPARSAARRVLRQVRRWTLFGLLITLSLVGIIAVAYLVEGPPNAFNADYGYNVASDSLIVPEDLPGAGWKIERRNYFDDSSIESDAGTCIATQQRIDEVEDAVARYRTGRASTELQRAAADPKLPSTSVNVEISVHRKQVGLQDAVAALGRALRSADARNCLEYSLKGSRVVDVPPSVAAPSDGTAYAYVLTVTEEGESTQVRTEMYVWRNSNVVVSVSAFGPPAELNAQFISLVLNRTQERLANKSDRPSTATATSSAVTTTPTATTRP